MYANSWRSSPPGSRSRRTSGDSSGLWCCGRWRIGLAAARAAGAEVVGPVEGLAAHGRAGVGRVDHFAGADDDADVAYVPCVAAEENEVAWRERLARLQVWAGVVLLLGNARQRDPGRLVGGLDEAGAVEAAGSLAAPHVRGADLGEREADRDRRRRRGYAGGAGAKRGRVGRRPAQHLVDVGLGVVVGEERAGNVGGGAGGAQKIWGREEGGG